MRVALAAEELEALTLTGCKLPSLSGWIEPSERALLSRLDLSTSFMLWTVLQCLWRRSLLTKAEVQ